MVYFIVCSSAKLYFKLFFKVIIVGEENLPKTGSCILCCNHTSNNDPIFIASLCKRKVRFMGKKELFEKPFKKWFFTNLNVFPVDRSKTDMKAFKSALEVLKNDGILGIFAHGTRLKEGDTKTQPKAGVALFAVKSGVDVIPVRITSTYKKFSKIVLTYGEPISFKEYADRKVKSDELLEITENIVAEIEKLKPAD